MKKAFVGVLGVVAAGGLSATAIGDMSTSRFSHDSAAGTADRAAKRATVTYVGPFKEAGPAARITIKATVKQGEATKVKSMQYRRLPASCPVSNSPTINGGWTLRGVTVNDQRKFRAVGSDGEPNPSSLRFSGKFNERFTKVKGKFQTRSYFPPSDPPEETCVSQTKRYSAKR
jgi:hypothetical protein